MRRRLSPQAKDMIWHTAKTVLCLVQFYIISVTVTEVTTSFFRATTRSDVTFWLMLPMPVLASIILFIAIWRYYDEIDDRSFDRFCAQEETPVLLRDPAYILAAGITIVGAIPAFMHSLSQSLWLLFPSLHIWAMTLICLGLSAGFVVGTTLYRVKDRNYVWAEQKRLRTRNDKRVKPAVRLIYAVIYFFALFVMAVLVLGMVLPLTGGLIVVIVTLFVKPAIVVGCLLVLLGVLRVFRRIGQRRKFLRRLEKMRDRGELSFTLHGRPYLSLFSTRVHFGLTVTDRPHPDSRVRQDVTYRVAVANCRRRRMVVTLADDQVYQFMYYIQFRVFTPTAMNPSNRLMTIPLITWFTSHRFEFPDGDPTDKKILLVDPAPHHLCIRGQGNFLITLDNASDVYDYRVYGRNAFLNVLERT